MWHPRPTVQNTDAPSHAVSDSLWYVLRHPVPARLSFVWRKGGGAPSAQGWGGGGEGWVGVAGLMIRLLSCESCLPDRPDDS